MLVPIYHVNRLVIEQSYSDWDSVILPSESNCAKHIFHLLSYYIQGGKMSEDFMEIEMHIKFVGRSIEDKNNSISTCGTLKEVKRTMMKDCNKGVMTRS